MNWWNRAQNLWLPFAEEYSPSLSSPSFSYLLQPQLHPLSPAASLTPLFSRAMRLEHAFFTAAALGCEGGGGGGRETGGTAKPLLPSLLVVDFDETLTSRDTTRLIIAAAASAVSARGDDAERRRIDATAAALVKRYVEEREALLQKELPSCPSASAASAASGASSTRFDPAATAAFLSKLSAFDREANTRVFDSRILAGISKGELFEAGKRGAAAASEGGGGGGEEPPLLRPGAAEALRVSCLSGVPTRVLSVSWSSELIEGALTGALGKEKGDIEISCDEAAWGLLGGEREEEEEEEEEEQEKSKKPRLVISANALEFDSSPPPSSSSSSPSAPALSTGGVLRRVECADDKLAQFAGLAASLGGRKEERRKGPAVFVGDSPSDLGALLAADVGIIITDSDSPKAELRRVAEALRIRVAPLSEASPAFLEGGDGGDLTTGTKTLFEAGSWGEVRRLLFGGGGGGCGCSGRGCGGGHGTETTRNPESFPSLAAAPPHPAVPRILSIAGSDSGGGAGIQADIKAASALGVFSATAITAVTVQNSTGVSGVFRVPAAAVSAQAEAVLGDIGADAIKTGMLPDAEAVEAVAKVVEKWRRGAGGGGAGSESGNGDFGGGGGAEKDPERTHRRFPLVVDPVLVSTSGDPLASGGVAAAIISRLFPLATVVTPNLPEAAALLGLDEGRDLGSLSGVAEAARKLAALGAAWVLVKGGHAVSGLAEGDDGEEGKGGRGGGGLEAVDVLFERSTGAVTFLRARRVETSVSHGTGCTLASAIACGLARGLSVPLAARSAKRYVGGALAASSALRLGRGPQFPMNHGYGTAACDWSSGEGLRMRDGEWGGQVDYRLYVVTDPWLVDADSMRAAVAAAVRGGATIVQVRDKEAGPAALAATSAEAVRGAQDGEAEAEAAAAAAAAAEAAGGNSSSSSSPSSSPSSASSVFVLVNDRVDVAAGTPGVAGAHVGQGDLPAPLARRALGHSRLLGISVRTPEQAVEAARQGADYVGAGAVFPTGSKEDAAVIGLDGLAEIVRASPVPVVAIGGVTAENAGQAIRAGASGVAVVSAVFGKVRGVGVGGGGSSSAAEDVETAARAVRAAVDAALAERRATA